MNMFARIPCPSDDHSRKRAAALFCLEVLSLSFYAWLSSSSSRSWLRLILLTLIAGVLFFGLLRLLVRYLARRTAEDPLKLSVSLIACFSPLLFLNLVFVQFIVFLMDLRPLLPTLSLLGSLYLLANFMARMKISNPDIVPRFFRSLLQERGITPKKAFPVLLMVSFAVYAFLASGTVFPPQPFTGDEPHYLVITKSLAADTDIDVLNNYQNKDYLAFYPGPLDSHAYPGKKGPTQAFSRHLPGLSLLILPAYLAGDLAGKILAGGPGSVGKRARILIFTVRLTMCLLAALLGGLFFLLALKFTAHAGASLLAWGVFSFTSPLLFYSQLIYPEIPVAIISLAVVHFTLLRKKPGTSALLLSGGGIALLPWFGVRYTWIAAGLFLIALPSVLKAGRRTGNKILILTLFPAASAAGYALYFWSLYGRISPFAAYTGAGPVLAAKGITLHVLSKASVTLRYVLGYLFDQRFGILPYSPVYILFFAGLILFLKKEKKISLALFALLAFNWAMCALTHIWGGYCPPGRFMLPLLWIMALFVAVSFASDTGRIGRAVRAAVLALSLLAAYAGLRNPYLLYHEDSPLLLSGPMTFSRLLQSLSNSVLDIKSWLPSFAGPKTLKGTVLALWLAAAALATYFSLRKRGPASVSPKPLRFWVHGMIVLILSVVVLGYVFFDVRLDQGYPLDDPDRVLYFQDAGNQGMEAEGFWTRGSLETSLLIASPQPLSSIRVALSSPVAGKTSVRAGMSEKIVFRKRRQSSKTVEFLSPVGCQWKSGYLYSLRIKNSTDFIPARLDPNIRDGRLLGVFVTVSVR